jgi:hypothetical protein
VRPSWENVRESTERVDVRERIFSLSRRRRKSEELGRRMGGGGLLKGKWPQPPSPPPAPGCGSRNGLSSGLGKAGIVEIEKEEKK